MTRLDEALAWAEGDNSLCSECPCDSQAPIIASAFRETDRDCRAMYVVLKDLQNIVRNSTGRSISVEQIVAVCAPLKKWPSTDPLEAAVANIKELQTERDELAGQLNDAKQSILNVERLRDEALAWVAMAKEALTMGHRVENSACPDSCPGCAAADKVIDAPVAKEFFDRLQRAEADLTRKDALIKKIPCMCMSCIPGMIKTKTCPKEAALNPAP